MALHCSRRRLILAALASCAALFALLPAFQFAGVAQDSDLNAPSPAGTAGEVIAQGAAELSGGDMAWRVVQDNAEPLGEAIPQERALGFVVATGDALLLSDSNGNRTARLAHGEAAFTFEGQYEQRESLVDAPTGFLRLALVAAADAQDAGGDELIYGGDPFTAPAGLHDLDLVAFHLAPGRTLPLTSELPALIVVDTGAVTVAAADQEAETVSTGAATVASGEFSLTAVDRSARVLVVIIGPALPESASPPVSIEPTSTPVAETPAETGRIIVLTSTCPPNVTVAAAQDLSRGDPCAGGDAVTGMNVTRTNVETDETVSAVVGDNGIVRFDDTPAGGYQIHFGAGAGMETVGVCGGQDSSADLPVIAFASNSVNLELPAGKEYLCVTRTVSTGTGGELATPTA